MADGDKIGTIVNDPDFQSLGLADQQQFLSKVDPDFGKLKQGEFSTFLARYKGSQQSPEQQQIAQLPNAAMQAKQQLAGIIPDTASTTILSHPYGGGGQVITGSQQDIQAIRENQQRMVKAGATAAAATLTGGLSEVPGALGVLGRMGLAGVGGAGGEAAGQALTTGTVKPKEVATAGGLAAIGQGIFGEALPAAINLPSASKAGATINQIVGANKDLPVPTFDATAEAVRAKEMFQAGAPSLPAPMRRWLTRVMDPDKPPVTLSEARDFYTNATKQTAKEWSEMNAPMKRQMATFTKALGQNIEDALNQNNPGQGTALRQAMDEYGSAMSLKSGAIKALKWGGAAVGADALTRILAKRIGGK